MRSTVKAVPPSKFENIPWEGDSETECLVSYSFSHYREIYEVMQILESDLILTFLNISSMWLLEHHVGSEHSKSDLYTIISIFIVRLCIFRSCSGETFANCKTGYPLTTHVQ